VSLLHLLKTSSLYYLDRLDLTVKTTFDAVTQSRVSDVLARLGNRDLAQALGLDGPNLLGPEDPSGVAYSVVLYERGADRNVLRVRADSMNQPFDLNSGSKLILGSTAKLRTLITYLHVIGQLHETYQGMSSRDLWDASEKASDPLSQWAAAYLAQASDRGLQAMLDAAVQRRYSANPGATFFTGGGIHVFQNYEHLENSQRPTVEEAFVHSINLAFIRIMRDIRDYYIREAKIADAKEDEAQRDVRERYLSRFADEEGIAYLARFYEDLHGRSPQGMLLQLADQTNRTPKRLAVLFRSVLPRAPAAELKVFLENELAGITLSEELRAALGIDRLDELHLVILTAVDVSVNVSTLIDAWSPWKGVPK
jgi:membrane peptidoglycan carboxypeptidase